MNKELVTAAFKTAVFARHNEGHIDLSDLIHHNDYAAKNAKPQFLLFHPVNTYVA
jgi:hypothetical protein